ncbi:MAG: chemotaxis protein [Bosea sp.]|uniref:methyl-accepting chemotaxis protein n=1 Tax=Bosea sp. (in: a-proteobacteria) TaxID=1871050 RepID=UPI001AC2FE5B|nr:methyl-accepting chemotaxis protein [Bosea sp. (in: a-proteobacteria)]MBN9469340.1 chemotaxis protein [Bosea sp. (in: a-proteobacteria)]
MTDVEQLRIRFARIMVAVLWANAALLVATSIHAQPENPLPILICNLGLASFGTATWWLKGTGWVVRQVTSICTMGQVMLLLYIYVGHPYQVDIHMYFFAMLAILAAWLDWRIFISASAAIVAHHTVLSLIYPAGVFPNGGSFGRVALHAGIVVVQVCALSWIVAWLRSAFATSESERKAALGARFEAEQARGDLMTATEAAAAERREALSAVASDFESKVAGIAQDVYASVQALRSAALQMTTGASEAAERSHVTSISTRQTSSNVVAVTQATSELSSSIREIDQRMAQSLQIVGSTTENAEKVLTSVAALSGKVDGIGNVVAVISEVAAQTNLLALNAAIEAARVGRAGSGFAVVAQEVKALANQISSATEEVQSSIGAIRSSGSEAAACIKAMGCSIGLLNEVAMAIASVVEEQNTATLGIARNIEGTAQEVVATSENVEAVSRIAAETGIAAQFVAESAEQLSRQSHHLDAEVAAFLKRVRAA